MSAPRRRIAFLLAQLGADATAAFEKAIAPLNVTASEAGMLRLVGRQPGITQKAAGEHLGVGPSRVVAVLDQLEQQSYVERRRSASDRRSHEIHLTTSGTRLLAKLRPIAERHERTFTEMLNGAELDQLGAHLETMAAARGLSLDVHRNTHDRS